MEDQEILDVFTYCRILDVRGEHEYTQIIQAGQRGYTKVISTLRNSGYQWDERVCVTAMSNKFYDTVKWLIDNKCPHETIGLSTMAAIRQDTEVLRWLLEKGCPLDRSIFFVVESSIHWTLEMVQLLHSYNCRLSKILYESVPFCGDGALLKWLDEHFILLKVSTKIGFLKFLLNGINHKFLIDKTFKYYITNNPF